MTPKKPIDANELILRLNDIQYANSPSENSDRRFTKYSQWDMERAVYNAIEMCIKVIDSMPMISETDDE